MPWSHDDATAAGRKLETAVKHIRGRLRTGHEYRDHIEVARTQLFILKTFHAQRFPEGDGTVRALLESEGRG